MRPSSLERADQSAEDLRSGRLLSNVTAEAYVAQAEQLRRFSKALEEASRARRWRTFGGRSDGRWD